MKKAKNADQVEKLLTEFDKWLSTLSVIEEMNFKTLINLPNAAELVSKLPDGEYKKMAIFGMALISAGGVS